MQQVPPPPPVYLSPDGRYWWNGSQWVPLVPPCATRRSAAPYVLASLFLPGLGSLLLGRIRAGLALMGATIACWVAWMIALVTLVPRLQIPTPTRCVGDVCFGAYSTQLDLPRGLFVVMAIFGPIGMVAWILGIVDAVRGTSAWNREHGLPE